MPRDLPARASLEHLRAQAKALLRDVQQHRPDAVERFQTLASRPPSATPKLADAQHVIAREYGFATWAELKAHVEAHTPAADPFVALVAAIRGNDTGRVAELLRRHAGLGSRLDDPVPDDFGAPPLALAVRHENHEMIDLLLHHGASINARSHWWAGSFGVLDTCSTELAPFLIERGATVDVHAAARLGMMDVLDALVSADPALVHARGGDGQTPLHFARTVEVARYLLDHGADIDARDIDHESTPTQWMVRDRPEVARFLVAGGCRTDILMAAALGDVELVRRLLDDDPASIRTRVADQYFPMRNPRAGGTIYIWTLGRNKTAHVIAREFGHEPIFQLLMERSSDELKLAQACDVGDENTFRALLARHPALARTLSADERRKLAEAAASNNTAAVRLMLAAGWPVDVRGDHDATPLHHAAWLGNAEMVRALLQAGAPVEVRGDQFDHTPLEWALHGSQHSWRKDAGDYAATIEALLDAGAQAPEIEAGMGTTAQVRDVLRRHAERRTKKKERGRGAGQ
jgi:ankyrin repeat protein